MQELRGRGREGELMEISCKRVGENVGFEWGGWGGKLWRVRWRVEVRVRGHAGKGRGSVRWWGVAMVTSVSAVFVLIPRVKSRRAREQPVS